MVRWFPSVLPPFSHLVRVGLELRLGLGLIRVRVRVSVRVTEVRKWTIPK